MNRKPSVCREAVSVVGHGGGKPGLDEFFGSGLGFLIRMHRNACPLMSGDWMVKGGSKASSGVVWSGSLR